MINDFSEEVDKYEVCDETSMIPFIGQNFLSPEETFVFLQEICISSRVLNSKR